MKTLQMRHVVGLIARWLLPLALVALICGLVSWALNLAWWAFPLGLISYGVFTLTLGYLLAERELGRRPSAPASRQSSVPGSTGEVPDPKAGGYDPEHPSGAW